MPPNMSPKEFGASVAHQYVASPSSITEEIILEKPDIVSIIQMDREDRRITISPEEIKLWEAPSPEETSTSEQEVIVEKDVIPYKI